jgi:effector-binding domain-containing protein
MDEEVEAIFPIAGSLTGSGRVQVYELPGVEVAAVVHHGDFDEFGRAYRAILRWIETNGYQITGPYREIYLKHDRRNLKETTTEIQFPIVKPS